MNEKAVILYSMIQKEWPNIERLFREVKESENDLAQSKGKARKREAIYLSYLIHNMYCSFETIFKEIAKSFENHVEDTKQFHAELLRKMNMAIYKMRPAFLSDGSMALLDELRRFRHVFRHAYENGIDVDRVAAISERISSHFSSVEKDKSKFDAFLRQVIETP